MKFSAKFNETINECLSASRPDIDENLFFIDTFHSLDQLDSLKNITGIGEIYFTIQDQENWRLIDATLLTIQELDDKIQATWKADFCTYKYLTLP